MPPAIATINLILRFLGFGGAAAGVGGGTAGWAGGLVGCTLTRLVRSAVDRRSERPAPREGTEPSRAEHHKPAPRERIDPPGTTTASTGRAPRVRAAAARAEGKPSAKSPRSGGGG